LFERIDYVMVIQMPADQIGCKGCSIP